MMRWSQGMSTSSSERRGLRGNGAGVTSCQPVRSRIWGKPMVVKTSCSSSRRVESTSMTSLAGVTSGGIGVGIALILLLVVIGLVGEG